MSWLLAVLLGALAPDAAVLTLQNGLGNAEKIDEILGVGTAMPGAAHIESATGEPGLIVQSKRRLLIASGK